MRREQREGEAVDYRPAASADGVIAAQEEGQRQRVGEDCEQPLRGQHLRRDLHGREVRVQPGQLPASEAVEVVDAQLQLRQSRRPQPPQGQLLAVDHRVED
eukprot:scaffold7957_cov129-Ochromonas_danica.AAC.3